MVILWRTLWCGVDLFLIGLICYNIVMVDVVNGQIDKQVKKRRVGLIAGEGRLPVMIAEGIRAAGCEVCCVGLRDQYDDDLRGVCDEFRIAGVVRLGRWGRLLNGWGVDEAILCGRVKKSKMYDPLKWIKQVPDLRTLYLWYVKLRHDRRSHKIHEVIADELGRKGIVLIDSTEYIKDEMAVEGVMGKREPSAGEMADVRFGWPILQAMSGMDIGQAIAVKDGDVIAVEAIEGTDKMVVRAGELCRSKGWVLIKSARDDHDMRFDVPTVGVRTVQKLYDAGGRCLAVRRGKVILAERVAMLKLADELGVAVVGV